MRLDLITAVVCLSACTQAGPAPIIPTPMPNLPPATSTAFLPRGFEGLPGASAPTDAGPPASPTLPPPSADGELDLSTAADRLNLLRAEDGVPALLRVAPLDQIAQERAKALAASGSLWHVLDEGPEPQVEIDLRSAGFSGQVAEVVLSVGAAERDPLGLVLQALLTDPANRGLVFGPQFRRLGLGSASDATSWYVVGLLAQDGPSD